MRGAGADHARADPQTRLGRLAEARYCGALASGQPRQPFWAVADVYSIMLAWLSSRFSRFAAAAANGRALAGSHHNASGHQPAPSSSQAAAVLLSNLISTVVRAPRRGVPTSPEGVALSSPLPRGAAETDSTATSRSKENVNAAWRKAS